MAWKNKEHFALYFERIKNLFALWLERTKNILPYGLKEQSAFCLHAWKSEELDKTKLFGSKIQT